MNEDIYSLSSDIVDEIVAAVPILATYLGIPGYDHLWNDFSVEGYDAVAGMMRDQIRRVRSLPDADDEWAELAGEVVVAELERDLADHDLGEHYLDLNSIASTPQDLRDTFDQMDKSSAEGWENIASRLERLPAAAEEYVSRMNAGKGRGSTVARRQVEEVVRQARNHAGADSHFTTYPASLTESGLGDAALLRRLAAGVELARSGFGRIADYLEQEYLPAAAERDAVGPERYAHLAARFLGAQIDPVATYEWGWEEVERLRARMADLAEEILPGGGLAAALELLLTDPGRAAKSQDEFSELMLQRQMIALRELDGEHFDVPDEIKSIDVKMTPPGGSLGAYYYSPSEDFKRPGTIYWSKGDQQQIPLFDEISTAYHEGFPGHHLQTGLQLTAGDRVSRMQKLLIWYSGSGEGWALYAEDLMEELGYLEKPDYVMGKLASEMLRACRVVIDIGSHLELQIPQGQPFHPGEHWTFESGVEMLDAYAAQDHAMSVSEMNRYLGWPGQAISYKVGQQAIRDLRSEEMARLGAGYDQKAFHSRLLEVGAVGLDVLRDHVRGGVARAERRPQG
ncbi:MAG: DUF885 domain-containing protein [Acidimicrobiia bacterium]